MKRITKTKIYKSCRSLTSVIPNTIVSMESLTESNSIEWSYDIIDNQHRYYIEFIQDDEDTGNTNKQKPVENNKNTSQYIDVTNEKQEKKIPSQISLTQETKNKTIKEPVQSKERNTIIKTSEHESETDESKRYEELLDTNSHRIENMDKTYTISIQKNQRKTKLTFKLHFTTTKDKQRICNITYKEGTLSDTQKMLSQLSKMNKDEVNTFILKENPKAETNLKKYNLL